MHPLAEGAPVLMCNVVGTGAFTGADTFLGTTLPRILACLALQAPTETIVPSRGVCTHVVSTQVSWGALVSPMKVYMYKMCMCTYF